MDEMRVGPKETWDGFVSKVKSLKSGQGAFVPAELFERFFGVSMSDRAADLKANKFAEEHGVKTQPRRNHDLVVFYKD